MNNENKKYSLLNGWEVEGTDLETFKAVIEDLTERTCEIEVSAKDIEVASYYGMGEYQGRPVYALRSLNQKAISDLETEHFLDAPSKQNSRKLFVRPDNEDILKEEMVCSHVHLLVPECGTQPGTKPELKHYFISDEALTQLAGKVSLGGTAMQQCTLARDLLLAETLSKKAGKLKFIVRTVITDDTESETGKFSCQKIFGVLTDKYQRVPQDVLYKAIEALQAEKSLGEADVHVWHVDQDFSEIRVEFPEKAADFAAAYGLPEKVVPGLRLCTSETGQSSVIVQPTYRIGSAGYAIGDETVKTRHVGDVSTESILEEMGEVMKNLDSFPKALMDRLGVKIGNADLSSLTGRRENKRLVMRCVRAGMKALGINKILGKKGKKAVTDAISAEIKDSVRYTEYDIALIMMGLSNRVAGSRNTLTKLEKACGRAANIPYLDLGIREEEEEEIFVVA